MAFANDASIFLLPTWHVSKHSTDWSNKLLLIPY